jgi:hypothetical protein
MKWMSWLNCGLGLWLMAAPFALAYTNESSALYDDVVLGILIASFAFSRALSAETPFMVFVSLAVATAGLWVLLAPHLFAYTAARAAFRNDTVVGSAVFVLGFWHALSSGERARANLEPHQQDGPHRTAGSR